MTTYKFRFYKFFRQVFVSQLSNGGVNLCLHYNQVLENELVGDATSGSYLRLNGAVALGSAALYLVLVKRLPKPPSSVGLYKC